MRNDFKQSPREGLTRKANVMLQDDFPSRVRDERKRRRMTQQQLADEAKLSLRMVQMFEGGKSASTPANRRAIAAVLGLDETGGDIATETRSGWPPEIQVFLDVMGAYLATMTEEERLEFMREWTRQVFNARNR